MFRQPLCGFVAFHLTRGEKEALYKLAELEGRGVSRILRRLVKVELDRAGIPCPTYAVNIVPAPKQNDQVGAT